MIAKQRSGQNDTEASSRQFEREYHAVPAAWMEWGRHQIVPDSYARFYAEVMCVEYYLKTERESKTKARVDEVTQLHVRYRNPETGERVERTFELSLLQSDDDTVRVWSRNADSEDGRVDYPGLSLGIDGFEEMVALPRLVYQGEPSNWPASIAVHPDEPRLEVA